MHGKAHQRSGLVFALSRVITQISLGIAAVFISFICVLLDYASDLAGACVFILILIYIFCLLW